MTTLPTDPRVAVVIPAFEVEATIGETIASALAQTHESIEVIVVDDGSTDGTAREARDSFDGRCRLVHQANAGPSAARNRGAAETDAPFLAFLDGDDVWEPGKLAAQLVALHDQPDAVLAYGWADVVDADLAFVCADVRATHSGDVYAELLQRNFVYSGSNSLIDADAFRKTGGFDHRLWGAEDWELHCRLARVGPVAAVPEVVVRYRQRPGSLRSDLDRMAAAYELASRTVFSAAPPELAGHQAKSDAAFAFYLAGQATQTGRVGDLPRAVRLMLRSVRTHPATVARLLRDSAPVGAARLTSRAFGRG